MTSRESHRRMLAVFLNGQAECLTSLVKCCRGHMDDDELDSAQTEGLRAAINKMESTAETLDRAVILLRTKPA